EPKYLVQRWPRTRCISILITRSLVSERRRRDMKSCSTIAWLAIPLCFIDPTWWKRLGKPLSPFWTPGGIIRRKISRITQPVVGAGGQPRSSSNATFTSGGTRRNKARGRIGDEAKRRMGETANGRVGRKGPVGRKSRRAWDELSTCRPSSP